jgi:hypothetical protein
MWPKPIDHTFLLCDPSKEPDRAAYLQTWLKSHSISPSSYTMGLHCYGTDLTIDEAYKVYDPWQNRKPIEAQRSFNSYNLKLGEISLVLNWAHAARTAVTKGYAVVMILESDVIFNDGFLENLEKAMNLLETKQTEWDFLSLSAGANLRPVRAPGHTDLDWFRVNTYYHTRTTDAMIFKVSMLEKILGSLFPFAEVLDWELNYQLTLHKSNSFWLDPPILYQGSGKIYPTTL